MKINEVEAKTGITKKNIRFYEEQKLLNPKRNVENGYRVYSEEDVRTLQQIKMMRKLGVSIEEIRQMLLGHHTISDGMQRHLVTLEREKQNTEHAISICKNLLQENLCLADFDPEEVFRQMETMEATGATFKNKQNEDVRVQYVAPVICAVLAIALITGAIALIIWSYLKSPEDSPPLAFIVVCLGILAGIGGGVLLALFQRIREIGKGEVKDARGY